MTSTDGTVAVDISSPTTNHAGRATRRVVRIIARLNVGGPSWHVMILDRGLRGKGWETLLVHGLVADGEAEARLHGPPEVNTHLIPELGRRIRPWSDLVALVKILRVLRRVEPQVVHTHTAKAGTLGRLAAALYNLRRPPAQRCLVVHTFHGHVLHGYFGVVGTALVRAAERTLARVTDRVVTLSGSQRDELVTRYCVAPRERTVVIPLGLDLRPLLALDATPDPGARVELGLPADALVVAFVGRLVAIKQPVLLLQAFRPLLERHARARLLVVGDGPLRPALESEIARCGLQRFVVMAGWQRELSRVYGATDVVALSSANEGTPVALIEAMAAARPVVATAVGGVPDLVVHRQNGLLVPPGDVDALSRALCVLASEPGLRRRFGQAGRSVAARYDSARLVEDVDGLYTAGLNVRLQSVVRGDYD